MVQEYFLLSRRKVNSMSKIKIYTHRNATIEDECFRFEQSISRDYIYLSLPYLQNCFHFALTNESGRTFANFEQPLDTISFETLHGVLASLGVIEFSFECKHSNCFVLASRIENVTNTCSIDKNTFGFEIKKFYSNNKTNVDWLHTIGDYLMQKNFKLFLHSYSKIHLRIEISCLDSLQDMLDLVDECLKFYDGEYCVFQCSEKCDYEHKVSVWQLNR